MLCFSLCQFLKVCSPSTPAVINVWSQARPCVLSSTGFHCTPPTPVGSDDSVLFQRGHGLEETNHSPGVSSQHCFPEKHFTRKTSCLCLWSFNSLSGHSNCLIKLVLWNSTALQFSTELKDQRTAELSFTVNFVLWVKLPLFKAFKKTNNEMLSNHGGTHSSKTACYEIINRKFLHTPIKNGSPLLWGYYTIKKWNEEPSTVVTMQRFRGWNRSWTSGQRKMAEMLQSF